MNFSINMDQVLIGNRQEMIQRYWKKLQHLVRGLCHQLNIMKDLICYCFEYSVDDIIQDYLENGKSTILEKIQMEKKFGNCQCATKNPKGK